MDWQVKADGEGRSLRHSMKALHSENTASGT